MFSFPIMAYCSFKLVFYFTYYIIHHYCHYNRFCFSSITQTTTIFAYHELNQLFLISPCSCIHVPYQCTSSQTSIREAHIWLESIKTLHSLLSGCEACRTVGGHPFYQLYGNQSKSVKVEGHKAALRLSSMLVFILTFLQCGYTGEAGNEDFHWDQLAHEIFSHCENSAMPIKLLKNIYTIQLHALHRSHWRNNCTKFLCSYLRPICYSINLIASRHHYINCPHQQQQHQCEKCDESWDVSRFEQRWK